MTKLIQQKTDSDCVICCVAMATETSYFEVLQYRQEVLEKSDINLKNGGNVLADFIPYIFDKGYTVGANFTSKKPISLEGIESFEFCNILNMPAFITVPSNKFKGSLHQIYYNGNKVFDPNPNYKTHPLIEDLAVTEWLNISYYMGRMKRIVKKWKDNQITLDILKTL